MCKEYINLQTKEVLDLEKLTTLPDNAMLKVKPELWIEWDFEKNDELGFDIWKMTQANAKKVWWICRECKNDIDVVINTRVNTNSKCPYCAGKRATKENSLATLYPEITKEWHLIKNKQLTPQSILPYSHKKVWWSCEKGHEWETSVSHRTFQNSGCPYCVGQKVDDTNSLASLNPNLASEWHPTLNKELSPDNFTCGSNQKVWWLGKCGHEWEAKISSREKYLLGCPYCTNQKTLVGFNDIHSTNKLISKALVNYNDGLTYTDGSNKKVEVKCPDCNSYIGFRAICDLKTYGISCSKCSDGISYPERFLSNLLSVLNIEYEYNKKFNWIPNKYYDFYIPQFNLIIEVHGGQHYNGGFRTLGGKNSKEEFNNDKFKRVEALKNGIENYIELDCRESTMDHIKKSILNSNLVNFLKLHDVNWNDISEKSLISLVLLISKEFNDTNMTIKELALKYKLTVNTVYRYLEKGFEIGLTKYTHDKQKFPNICQKHNYKSVVVMSLTDEYINSYPSMKDALIDLNIYKKSRISSVSRCCRGTLRQAYGYKWMYSEDYEKMNNRTS